MQVHHVKFGLGPLPRGPKVTNKRKLCAHEGCLKQARDGTPYCISHGGGRRCEVLECTKSAVGSSERCKAHGGGRRCTVDGCTTAARPGPLQLCQKHGGKEPRRASGKGKSGLAIQSQGMVDGRWALYSDFDGSVHFSQEKEEPDMTALPPQVCTLTLAVQDEKGDMNIWKVEKAEEKAVLDALGDDFVLLDIPV